jgi:L-asparaginase
MLKTVPFAGLILRAVHSGLPVVCAGRGNTEGFVPLDSAAFMGASNLSATKPRLLLMACLMKFGALPPAANPDEPTTAESAVIHKKVAAYQAVFDTH